MVMQFLWWKMQSVDISNRTCSVHKVWKCKWKACLVSQELLFGGLPWWLSDKEHACQCRSQELDPWVGKTPLEKGLVTHSSTLAWSIPWTKEPGAKESDMSKGLSTRYLAYLLHSFFQLIFFKFEIIHHVHFFRFYLLCTFPSTFW